MDDIVAFEMQYMQIKIAAPTFDFEGWNWKLKEDEVAYKNTKLIIMNHDGPIIAQWIMAMLVSFVPVTDLRPCILMLFMLLFSTIQTLYAVFMYIIQGEKPVNMKTVGSLLHDWISLEQHCDPACFIYVTLTCHKYI